jgi:hypothetical protein
VARRRHRDRRGTAPFGCSTWLLASSILVLLASNRACPSRRTREHADDGPLQSNLRDVEFNLFEVFGTDRVLGEGPFAQLDTDSARDVLTEVERLASEDLAASFTDSDRNPPVFDPATGSSRCQELPQELLGYAAGGWDKLDLPESLGGIGAPASLRWAAHEMTLGANPAVYMFASGASFAAILHRNGTPEQQRFAELAIERQWGATMVLTEPDAGSDVGARPGPPPSCSRTAPGTCAA